MPGRIITTWAINIANSATFLATGGRRVLHEGRYRRGRWTDWAREHSFTPARFAQPADEAELRRLVREATKVRVVGAGHSFNDAAATDDLLLSLDRMAEVVVRDHPTRDGWKIAEVQAGARLRHLNKVLREHGASLPVAGSTNPQSIGGLLATDVHGTGRDHGFLSESVLSIRVVDAFGDVRTVRPGDELFHAVIGAAGTCGVVVSAELLCEPAYHLAKEVKVVPREWAESNLDALLEENDHLSFYYFGGLARSAEQDRDPGLAQVRMNKWNRTLDPVHSLRQLNKLGDELPDMVFSGHLIGLARVLHLADRLARVGFLFYRLVVNHRSVVYPSGEGFARLLYFRHDEIEYGVPYERTLECLAAVRELLTARRYPTIIEVRFTPDTSLALLGPGVGRRTTHIELAPSSSRASDSIFEEFEQIVLAHGGQPHLGKKLYVDHERVAAVYGDDAMARFEAVRSRQDPDGKFLNPFTERVLVGRRTTSPPPRTAPVAQ